MEPTLDTLDASLPGVKALHAFSNHIQELSELETTLSEPYEVQEKNISTFCEGIMDKIKGMTQEDVTLTRECPKLNVKSTLSNWNASCCIWLEKRRRVHPCRRKNMAGLQETRCAHPPVHHQRHRLRYPRGATRKHLQALHRSERPDTRRRSGTSHLLTDCHQDERQLDTRQQLQQGSTVRTGTARINHT